jgi:hypothetical protein
VVPPKTPYQVNPLRFNKRAPTMKKLQPVFINPPQNIESNIYLHKEESMA